MPVTSRMSYWSFPLSNGRKRQTEFEFMSMKTANNDEMNPVQLVRQEWMTNTTRHPKQHRISEFRPVFHTHEFRQHGQAIAWLNWTDDYIDIAKLEKLPGAGRGAAIPLVEFLKTLSDKYHIRLSCQVNPYTPDPPWSDDERKPSQEELEGWYRKRGFRLFTRGKPAPTWAWYPDAPCSYTDKSSSYLPMG